MNQPLMNKLLLALAALAIAPAAQAATNLVVNGGFESSTGGTAVNGGVTGQFIPNGNDPNGNSFNVNYGYNPVQLTGWYEYSTSANQGSPFNFLVAKGTVFTSGFSDNWDQGYRTIHQGSAPSSAAYSPAGGNFLMMDAGYHPTAINQNISGLVDGTSYTLTFDWAATQWSQATGNTTQDIQTTIGNSTLTTSTYDLGSGQFSGWMQASETFTYEGTNNVLSFLAQGTPMSLPPSVLIDGISLTANGGSNGNPNVVPEPTTWGLLLVGAGGLFAARRRRRAASTV